MRAAVLFALEIKAGDRLKDFQPVAGIATDFDLRARGSKRVERLIEQVPHHGLLWLIASRTDITDRQVVVHPHMALDEAGQLPVVGGSVVVLQDEDVPPRGGAPVTLAAALVVGMSEGASDRVAQRQGVACLGSSDAISQPTFFHGASCRTA